MKHSAENVHRNNELTALYALVDDFAAAMKARLREKMEERPVAKHGWDAPAWTIEDMHGQIIKQLAKGHPVDVANFAAFWWNRLP